ncbi:TetR family transcriptional regulator [Kineococcus aurantiacus]|uniref:AcrR family transcriptional regulator n=1 Tax=Kineococcus aurantiacus TaxID=37633 RepID=A0A7Y9DQH3_9ACTN|nr:AcrR family transcriptional regulator [Kineococcus aurantiacus]
MRSTAESQRARATASAVRVFARTGYHATPVTSVAAEAGISAAYVFRLFTDKLGLFVAALEHCFEQVRAALDEGAEQATGTSPEEVLEAMSVAYARLVADKDLLMLQVHAQSACDVPEVRDALQEGLASVVRLVQQRSGADDAAVQRFIAYGQLCHLIVTSGLDGLNTSWAKALTTGMTHVEPTPAPGPARARRAPVARTRKTAPASA